MSMSDWDEQHSEASTLRLNDMDMSPVEVLFFKKFTIIEVTGEKGRLVPILLTAHMKSAFD